MRAFVFITTLALAAAACSADTGPTDAEQSADATTSEDGVVAPADDVAADPDAAATEDAPPAPESDIIESSDVSDGPWEDVSSDQGDAVEAVSDAEVDQDSGWTGPDEEDTTEEEGNSEALLICHILCDDVWSDCGGYGPYGADQDSCVEACQGLAEVSLDSLVALACMAETCDEELCDPGETAFPIQPDCELACDLFDACGLLGSIQPEYPDGIELCQVECSASFVTTPEMVTDVTECVISGLQETCDQSVLEECFGGAPDGPGSEGPTCGEICDIAVNFNCAPWEDVPGAWSDPMVCLQDCEHYADDTESSPYTLYGCALSSSCQDLDQCAAPPETDDPGCEVLCTKTFQACGDEFMPSAEFCTDYCTGQLMSFGSKVLLEDANLCINELGIDCDADPYANMFSCLLQLDDECTIICEAMQACIPDGNPEGITDCQSSCNAGYMNLLGPKNTADLATCFTEAAGDCAAQDACMQGPQPPPCFSLCQSGVACETDPDLCFPTCEESLAAGGLADIACELVDECKTPGLCEGLDQASAPAECVDACNNAPEGTCGAYQGGCLAACQGLYIGSGASDPLMPGCMAAQLGEGCAIDNAYWSCVQF